MLQNTIEEDHKDQHLSNVIHNSQLELHETTFIQSMKNHIQQKAIKGIRSLQELCISTGRLLASENAETVKCTKNVGEERNASSTPPWQIALASMNTTQCVLVVSTGCYIV